MATDALSPPSHTRSSLRGILSTARCRPLSSWLHPIRRRTLAPASPEVGTALEEQTSDSTPSNPKLPPPQILSQPKAPEAQRPPLEPITLGPSAPSEKKNNHPDTKSKQAAAKPPPESLSPHSAEPSLRRDAEKGATRGGRCSRGAGCIYHIDIFHPTSRTTKRKEKNS